MPYGIATGSGAIRMQWVSGEGVKGSGVNGVIAPGAAGYCFTTTASWCGGIVSCTGKVAVRSAWKGVATCTSPESPSKLTVTVCGVASKLTTTHASPLWFASNGLNTE